MRNISRGVMLFSLVLLLLGGYYLYRNTPLDINSVSSDVWAYQYVELQDRFHYWSEVPPAYSKAELYVAFPLLYALNPGFEKELYGYHALALLIIAATYLVSGSVIYAFFRSWPLAALGGVLMIIPRYIFPTQVGILSLSQVRASTMLFPFYFLLSYYWILRGIADPRKNIALGALAGLGVYVYPPTAITSTAFGVAAALLLHRTRYWKEIAVFCTVFTLITLPFVVNHFTNPHTAIIDDTSTLTLEEQRLQTESLTRAFGGNASIFAVDFEEMKRIVWDQAPLLVLFALSLYLTWRYRELLGAEKVRISLISVYLFLATWIFVGTIELLNWYSISQGGTYVFSEHLRILRGIGFILFMQSALLLYLLLVLNKRWLAGAIAIALIVSPIFFFAPALRTIVRAVVPESIRLQYNLAPVVAPTEEKNFENLREAALWARAQVPEDARFFLFSEYQHELQFKLLSRHDTNMIEKEGALGATTGFENSSKWFNERLQYDEVVKNADTFEDITAFAREINMTHLLLPRGSYSELYDEGFVRLPVLYENPDYRILEL